MAKITKIGYGQVEPNHLSAQRNGKIYAQLPCAASIKQVENGMFLKYDYASDECNFDGMGEFMLVFNEVKIYDPKKSYKDFVYDVKDFTDGKMFPRLMKTDIGDVFTTNTFATEIELVQKDILVVGPTGYLEKAAEAPAATDTGMKFIVAKVYTLADGQPAVKVQRIQ